MAKYAVEITPKAQWDMDEAFDYIAFQLENPQAAYDLIDGIYSATGDLSSMPERFPVWKRGSMGPKGVRFLCVKNFNVFYVIDKKRRRVSVTRIIYGRRNI